MAYIATKATYIGEEEVKDENGKPIVDENDVPVKRIQTDVDDVIFTEGEVIVLIEKITEGKHFDLSIEDEGSTYFAPTQIKIGDGLHSFKELNWLQTVDNYRVDRHLALSIAAYKTNVDKIYETFTNNVNAKIGEQNAIISDFVNYQSKEILKDLVRNNFFRINSWGGLIGFTTDSEEYAGKYCMSIGDNKSIERTAYGYTIGIGKNNLASSDYSLLIGTDNESMFNYSYNFGNNNSNKGEYSFISGDNSYAGAYSISCGHWCNYGPATSGMQLGSYTACFGENCNTLGIYSFSCGIGNHSYGLASFTCGESNNTDKNIEGAFACGKYNYEINKLFSIGNGNNNKRSNAFDIDKNGKATFYGDLNCNKKLIVNDSLYSNKYIGTNGFDFLIGKNSNEIPAMTIDESGNCYIHGDLTIYGDVTSDINYSHKMLSSIFNDKNQIYWNGISIIPYTPGLYTIFYGLYPSVNKNYTIITEYIMLPSGTYTLKYKTQFKDNITISLFAQQDNSSPIATIDNTNKFDEDGYTDVIFQITVPTKVRMAITPLNFTFEEDGTTISEPIITPSSFYLSLTNTSQTTSILDTVALLAYDIDQLKKQINNNKS